MKVASQEGSVCVQCWGAGEVLVGALSCVCLCIPVGPQSGDIGLRETGRDPQTGGSSDTS